MKRAIFGSGFLIVATLFLIPCPVLATAILTLDGFVNAQARVPLGSIVDSDASHLTGGPVMGSVSDTRTAHAVGNLGGTADTLAHADFDGTAAFGLLRGTASAEAIGGTAIGQVTLRWDDDFRATSSTLPVGTPVDYRFTISLDSAITTNIACDGVSPPGPATVSLVGNDGAAGIIVHRACGLSDGASVLTLIHTTIGALVPLSGSLTLSASLGSSVSSRPDNMATADANHTGRFFVDPAGPDYSYVTSSGVTYFSSSAPPTPNPIPEPSTLSLIVLGLIVVGARYLAKAKRVDSNVW
jgi:hypothetical protein